MSANGMPPAFQFDTFPTALQHAIFSLALEPSILTPVFGSAHIAD
jgi:hypothetical protein